MSIFIALVLGGETVATVAILVLGYGIGRARAQQPIQVLRDRSEVLEEELVERDWMIQRQAARIDALESNGPSAGFAE